ncbi:acyltransferase [Chryseobacterium sp. 3008163]|uniref:acyltransferase n=1 Tax=Chryseobacterium sp. 3008163 TaxID=2478663 RepID=UPI000F0CAD50|nr:acyltransferase [Chryseobacterium sp. 3008163]AYM99966.1 acyltransferase [Chryseobacterium sp. 3008163]
MKQILNKINSLFKSKKYETVPINFLILNFLFQRIFFINYFAKYSVHYTSRVSGSRNIVFNVNDPKILASFAASGGCYFSVFDNTILEIGDGTIWSYGVGIHTANHDFFNRDIYIRKSIKIGKNCWIGHGAVITAGVELGDNVTVGANSVVTKSFPNNVVIGGIPAKIIKELQL